MSTVVKFTAPSSPDMVSRIVGACDDCKASNMRLKRLPADEGAWVCETCMEKRPGVHELPEGGQATKIASGLVVWRTPSRQLMMLGGETPEEAKVTIDLTNGEVTVATPVEEGAKLFWEAAEALLKVQLGTGARCSCECGCNRKLNIYEAFQKVCAVCDAGIHEKKETKESVSE